MKALGSNIIVKVLPVEEKTAGGLYLADESKKPSQKGIVQSVGPDWLETQEHNVEKGDLVMYALSAEQAQRAFKKDKEDYLTLIPTEVILIL